MKQLVHIRYVHPTQRRLNLEVFESEINLWASQEKEARVAFIVVFHCFLMRVSFKKKKKPTKKQEMQ